MSKGSGAQLLPAALQPLTERPQSSALLLDFDGTLSLIVEDPTAARPLPEVPDLLVGLAERFGLVAVISGRPVAFLNEVLRQPRGVRLVGLYGLEWIGSDGERAVLPEAEPWEAVVSEVTRVAAEQAPAGVYVEPKGLTVTLHWRHAPEHRPWVERFVEGQVTERGLVPHGSKYSLELGPPLQVDKGTVATSLVKGMTAAAAFGDDFGDLPVFRALGQLSGVSVARVAVAHGESPREVAAEADVVVGSAAEAVRLLQSMLTAASS
ncbi:MAG TPA: trehalose-phosphatase [Acidimicrobiales bacterium]